MKYVYFLKHIPTGMMYIGSKYGLDADPRLLWKTYFTSSKKVRTLIDEYGPNSFEWSIRKTFEDREECYDYERRLLQRLKVKTRNDFLNEHHNDDFQPKSGGRRYKRPPATKYWWITNGKRDIKVAQNQPFPPGFYRGRSKGGRYGKRTPEFCKKMSELRKGVPLSEHHLQRIRETRVGMLGKKHTNETKQKQREARLRYLSGKNNCN